MLCRTFVNSRPVQRHLISWVVPFLMLDWDGLFPIGCRNVSAQAAAEFNQHVNVGMRWEPLISSAQTLRTTQVIHWREKSFSPAQLGVFESEQLRISVFLLNKRLFYSDVLISRRPPAGSGFTVTHRRWLAFLQPPGKGVQALQVNLDWTGINYVGRFWFCRHSGSTKRAWSKQEC